MTDLLRSYLAKQCKHINLRQLEYTVFIIARSVEALTHAAVLECPDLLQERQLEKEINKMLLSYLSQK